MYLKEMRQFTEDRRKLKELILYVSQRCASKPGFGSTILYKILYFADHLAFGKLGEPITGAEYMAEKHGPIPRRMLPARQELEREHRLKIEEIGMKRSSHVLKKPVALATPDTSVFSPEQLALVDGVIEKLWDKSTRQTRTETHRLAAWRAYKIGETVPYESVYVSPNQRLTRKEVEIGQEIARRRGWLRTVR